MTVHTQTDARLVLTLDGQDYACQVINAEFTYPAPGEATLVPVACGDAVSEPGDPANGSITGEVFKDTSASGITRALIAALESKAEIAYAWTEGEDTDATRQHVTGTARVSGHRQSFAPDKFGRHPLALTVTTATTTWGAV